MKSVCVALVPPLIVAILPIYITWQLVDSVKQAIEDLTLQTTNAADMKPLLVGFNTTKSAADDIYANARALGAFGRFAVPPLIQFLNEGTFVQIKAAEVGLFTAGLTDINGTCPILVHVLDNRTRRYSWLTHQSIGSLLADLNCPKAALALIDYQNLLDSGLNHYAQVVSPPDSPDKFDSLKKAIKEDLSRLSKGD